MECSIRSFAPRALPQAEVSLSQMVHQCSEVVNAAEQFITDPDHSRQFFNNLVFCQTLLLLFIAADRPKPGVVGGPSGLLGRLAGHITEIGLNDPKILSLLREQDFELYQAARQTFWVAQTLDRLHASHRSKDLIMPLHPGSLSRDDYKALGEEAYHLARM